MEDIIHVGFEKDWLVIADDYSKLYFLGIMQICKNGLR